MRLAVVLFLIMLILAGCVEKEEAVVATEKKPAPPLVEEAPEAPETQLQKEKVEKKAGLTIADILNNPAAYEGKEVTLRGRATPGLAFEFVDEQPYLLSDGTGEIWVITRAMMPMQGAEVTVRGEVVVPYQIKGRHYEVAIIEIDREEEY
jgi:hypothetical protein